MDMTGEYLIAAPRDAVWAALNDTETLKACIAGCEELTRSAENEFTARVVAKIGPVKAGFGGKVTLSEINPPHGYTITGEGQGGAAGFAKGGAKVVLEAQQGGRATLLKYVANAQIGGKLAQIGSRLVEGSAKKMADEFFAAFANRVQGENAGTPPLEAALEALPESAPTHGVTAHHPAVPAAAADDAVQGNSRGLVILGGIVVVLLLAVLALFFF
jgi:hypothetical protein